jgi:hypothetical protein
MPVKSKRDEEKWQKAKAIAEEQGKGDNWAYIMGIYKKMDPDYFKEGSFLNDPQNLPSLYSLVTGIDIHQNPGGPNFLHTSDGRTLVFHLEDGPRRVETVKDGSQKSGQICIDRPVGQKIPGGKAEGRSPDEFNPEALAEGVRVEMEHTNDPQIAMEISMDHLTEDPLYYTKLKTIHKDALRVAARYLSRVASR